MYPCRTLRGGLCGTQGSRGFESSSQENLMELVSTMGRVKEAIVRRERAI